MGKLKIFFFTSPLIISMFYFKALLHLNSFWFKKQGINLFYFSKLVSSSYINFHI